MTSRRPDDTTPEPAVLPVYKAARRLGVSAQRLDGWWDPDRNGWVIPVGDGPPRYVPNVGTIRGKNTTKLVPLAAFARAINGDAG